MSQGKTIHASAQVRKVVLDEKASPVLPQYWSNVHLSEPDQTESNPNNSDWLNTNGNMMWDLCSSEYVNIHREYDLHWWRWREFVCISGCNLPEWVKVLGHRFSTINLQQHSQQCPSWRKTGLTKPKFFLGFVILKFW